MGTTNDGVKNMRFETINLWKYWKKPHNARDFSLINIDLHDEMVGGIRILLFNVGFKIIWK